MFSKLTLPQRLRAGRRYEEHIARMLQSQGWDIFPRAKYGRFDRGIDLVASKAGRTRYIQCKGWSARRTLRENVIDQLYGAVAYQVGPEDMPRTEVFIYTAAQPSLYARAHAKRLNIEIFHEPFPYWQHRHRIVSLRKVW